MNVISKRALVEFFAKHPQAKNSLLAWYQIAYRAKWSSFAEMKADFNSADLIGNNRFVFNIGGNKYRVISCVLFAPSCVMFIKFVGTHADYDKIDARTV